MNELIKDLWAMSHDGDAWGQAMTYWFAISETLFHHNQETPDHWMYNPGLGTRSYNAPEDWPDAEINALYVSGDITTEELIHAGNVFCRLAHICKAQGLDY